jgi:glycosyltransferase involved in cell wall biosynthesis
MHKPLFVRHCGNWFVQHTVAERFWKWCMEYFAGGHTVMLATGGSANPPSERNPAVRWIFSTSLTMAELSELACRSFWANQPRKLIIACRQDYEKGTGRVIESLPYLISEFPDLSLDVVGDGRALPEFRRLADSLALSDRIRFHGKLNHEGVLKLLSQATLFCYPTTASEGFPKVALEAQACGLPIVTTSVSVLPQLVQEGGGILLEDVTPRAIASAVGRCLRNPEALAAMSQVARKSAERYSLERWRDEIGSMLRASWGPF